MKKTLRCSLWSLSIFSGRGRVCCRTHWRATAGDFSPRIKDEKTFIYDVLNVREEKNGIKTNVLIAMAVLVSLVLIACSSSATPVTPTQTPEPSATSERTKSQRLAARWIEVLLDEQKVLLHDGDEIVGEYLVSTGVGTSPETTTYPGEYWVQTMWRGPEETAPGVFVKDVVIFDWEHGNGFHSLPMDGDGNVLDPTLGEPASAGCIRMADSDELYQFAETGMKVVIH